MTLKEFIKQFDKPNSIVLLEGKRNVLEVDSAWVRVSRINTIVAEIVALALFMFYAWIRLYKSKVGLIR